ncbi:GntR family transcriptional regulator [Orbus wheelerorum]|uniref:GntR family transcriptional regulator n=1 Tax=Orbus wheelerorum TaxID=3074111 RepID=UPI00370D5DA5
MKFDLIYLAIKKLIYQYNIGTRLPSELQLSGEFNVSRATIRKALTILKNDGIIRSQKGKGYFLIKQPSPDITDNLSFIKISPNVDEYKILHFELLTATLNLSQLLQCQNGEKLFLLKKTLSLAGQTKIIIDQYIPFNKFPLLSIEELSHCAILLLNEQLSDHIIYQAMFKPAKAGLALDKILNCVAEQPIQQAFITAKKLDNSLMYFTIVSYDPTQIKISFNHQI